MIKQLLQGIFSIKNEYNVKRMFKHKVITLCFLKFKIGYKPKSIVIIGPGGIIYKQDLIINILKLYPNIKITRLYM